MSVDKMNHTPSKTRHNPILGERAMLPENTRHCHPNVSAKHALLRRTMNETLCVRTVVNQNIQLRLERTYTLFENAFKIESTSKTTGWLLVVADPTRFDQRIVHVCVL